MEIIFLTVRGFRSIPLEKNWFSVTYLTERIPHGANAILRPPPPLHMVTDARKTPQGPRPRPLASHGATGHARDSDLGRAHAPVGPEHLPAKAAAKGGSQAMPGLQLPAGAGAHDVSRPPRYAPCGGRTLPCARGAEVSREMGLLPLYVEEDAAASQDVGRVPQVQIGCISHLKWCFRKYLQTRRLCKSRKSCANRRQMPCNRFYGPGGKKSYHGSG